MSATIINNRLTLEATGTGFQSAVGRFRFPAPGGTDMMVIFFRAYFDSYTADESQNYGWSNPAAFGLSFDGNVPMPTNHANFFGLSSLAAGGDTVVMKFAPDAFGAGEDGVSFGARGPTATYIGSTAAQPGPCFTSPVSPRGPWDLPANPDVGDQYTGVWIIRKSQNTSDIWISSGYNMESLQLDSLRAAKDSAGTTWYEQDTIKSEGTNWRPTTTTMALPQFLVFSLPTGVPGVKLIVERVSVDWYSYNQLVASADF